MGLFDKKFCDLCGEKIGLMGNRKLEDGNCCKDCAAKLSPWLTDRRGSTVEEIRQHLAYREENARHVPEIHPTRVLGNSTKIYIDDNRKQFFVTRFSNWQDRNPDILDISQVTSCQITVDERKNEQYQKDDQGRRVSYDPPRYEYTYVFFVTILVNSPWFNEIKFELTDKNPDSRYTDEYREYERQGEEIRRALDPEAVKKAELEETLKQALAQGLASVSGAAQSAAAQPVPAAEASTGWYCPNCGQQNSGNFCANCGTKRPVLVRKCASCGYQPEDQINLPRFCPQCGTPFNA